MPPINSCSCCKISCPRRQLVYVSMCDRTTHRGSLRCAHRPLHTLITFVSSIRIIPAHKPTHDPVKARYRRECTQTAGGGRRLSRTQHPCPNIAAHTSAKAPNSHTRQLTWRCRHSRGRPRPPLQIHNPCGHTDTWSNQNRHHRSNYTYRAERAYQSDSLLSSASKSSSLWAHRYMFQSEQTSSTQYTYRAESGYQSRPTLQPKHKTAIRDKASDIRSSETTYMAMPTFWGRSTASSSDVSSLWAHRYMVQSEQTSSKQVHVSCREGLPVRLAVVVLITLALRVAHIPHIVCVQTASTITHCVSRDK